jgi:hypothetical protein
MDVVYVTYRGDHMTTMDKFYVYKKTKLDNQINNKNTVMQNMLFYVTIQNDDKLGGVQVTVRIN